MTRGENSSTDKHDASRTARPPTINWPDASNRAREITALSFSFCCALEKFALDPATRGAVLDSACIANFPVLCALSARIFASLARFMYNVSCSPELVRRLVFQHDCLKVVASVFEPHSAVKDEEDEERRVEDNRVGSGSALDDGRGGGGQESPNGSLDGARETCAILLFNLSTQVRPSGHAR